MSTDINETRTDQDPQHEQSEQEWPSYEAAAAQQEATSENTESENTESEGYEPEGYESERAEGEQPAEPVEGTEPPESPEYGNAATDADEFPAFGESVQAATDEPDTEQSPAADEPVHEDTDLPRNTDPAEDHTDLDGSENPANSATAEGLAEDAEVESDGVPLPENLGGRNLDADSEPLVDAAAQQEFLSRWTRIQISFLEDPAAAVQSADVLVQEIGAAILGALEERGGELAASGSAATDTEQRRLALRQYRAYLGALLPL